VALPQHSAESLWLSGSGVLVSVGEAQPRRTEQEGVQQKGEAFPPCAAAKPLNRFVDLPRLWIAHHHSSTAVIMIDCFFC